ncbi:LOW QUALITY PROTEIN: cyclin N-terminal domain-containing protein 1 [Microcaecilia unicolor]|uniref:LOW QUALITY PROTEIN: cyclin N-terminal domain-containing protein 1 n=1 Tax=Microcaecilia unicolor TaxID=1415580 RepID=A0A6P7ZUN3_9AMPH|nr:LOW QUALITY PROTEIN: cyclin N-terminal domain-containing protein 1 [Microcaecilia unicolor]
MSELKEGQPVGCMRPSMVFGAVSSDTLEDVLLDLAKQNERSLSSLSQHAGCFKETRIVEFVFLLSEQWHLDNSARYQAVEILERFMIKHIEDVYSSAVMAQKDNDKALTDNWASFKIRCREIFLLRLVSCVQIASKLSFHCSVINNTTVLKFLQSLGYTYSKEELVESELTILKALQFQMNVATPCPYVEMLLEVLGHNGCELPMKHLHDICLKILDLVYLLRNSIYETLLRTAVENSSPSEFQRVMFLSVKEDLMLLAAGIIAASAFILNHECWSQVLEHLNCITGITVESILELSTAILNHSIGTTTPRKH